MPENNTQELLTQVKGTMEEYQKSLELRIKDLIAEGKSASDAKVAEIDVAIKGVKESLDSVKQNIALKGEGLPGLSDELKNKTFSFQNAIRGMLGEVDKNSPNRLDPWEDAGFEREILQQYSKKFAHLKANYAGDGSSGGYLVPPEVTSEVIGLAIANMPLLNGELPVKILSGLVGQLPLPKLSARPTGYMVGENAKPTESDASYAEIVMRPRRAAGFTKQSKRLIYQSKGVADSIIKAELANGMGLTMHNNVLNGKGGEYESVGLLNAVNTAQMTANTISLGTNGGRFTITDAGLMRMAIEKANEGGFAPANYGYLMRPEAKWGMKTERVTQYSGATTKGQPVLYNSPMVPDAMISELIGKLATTTQLSATRTKAGSSTLSDVIFGNWAFFYVGFWQGMSLRVSDQASDGASGSAFLQNQLYIIAEQELDCALVRGSAFTKLSEAETNPASW